MPRVIDVANLGEIPPGKAVCVTAGATVIAVFNCDGNFYAISDMCPHAGAPLSQGFVDGTRVTCAWHGWTIEMDPAKCRQADGVDRFKVLVQNGVVKVEVPD
jgi:nitrite reductase (NADH) small subunit